MYDENAPIVWADPPPAHQVPPQIERFLKRVDKTDTCWNWTGAYRNDGYGLMSLGRYQLVRAHRWSYQHFVGPIPDGLVLDHLCRNRGCVNPAHLEAVSDRVNLMRGISPAADNAKKTVCKRGHDDWYIRRDGNRQCRTCARSKQHIYNQTRHLKRVAARAAAQEPEVDA